jgi:hypothetical protein
LLANGHPDVFRHFMVDRHANAPQRVNSACRLRRTTKPAGKRCSIAL